MHIEIIERKSKPIINNEIDALGTFSVIKAELPVPAKNYSLWLGVVEYCGKVWWFLSIVVNLIPNFVKSFYVTSTDPKLENFVEAEAPLTEQPLTM